MLSWVAKLREAQAQIAAPVDSWQLRLERVRGKIGDDGIERISRRRCSTTWKSYNVVAEPAHLAALRE